MHYYLAFDLGAESGRLMVGSVSTGAVELSEIHRFPNIPLQQNGRLLWNIKSLWSEMLAGLSKAASLGLPYQSLSCDSWGLDYVMFDERNELIEPTYHYRDPRTDEGQKRVFARFSRDEIFQETGIQFMPINTIFQLAAETPARISAAKQIMLIADAFNFLLCGVASNEITNASTTQFYNPHTKNWSSTLLTGIGVSPSQFAPLVAPGTILGNLKPQIVKQTGLPQIPVIASCSHDTGAAVAAIQDCGNDWAYLSSGTWSLLGVVLDKPLINAKALKSNFTNEIGYGEKIRFLKNIAGLWLLQECRREWHEAGHSYDYAALTQLARESKRLDTILDVRDGRFWSPGKMTEKIRSYCAEHSLPCPSTHGEFTLCILESLAAAYARTLGEIEEVTSHKISRLHIVGGGSQNQLLNELTAKACNVQIITGPVEATAMGNILVQHQTLQGQKP